MTVNTDEAAKQKAAMYYNNIKGKFPTLKTNLRIHHWPSTDLLFGSVPEEKKASVFEKQTMTRVNESGLKLLSLCNGTKTTDQLIKEISDREKMDINTVTERMVKFLFFAENHYNHIHYNDNKSFTDIKFKETGSKEFYTPVHFVLELTNRCNFNCKHCYRLQKSYKPYDLTFDEITDIIDQMSRIGAGYVEITGGEFTLHKNFLDVISYSIDKVELLGLLTNGYLLNEDIINKMDIYRDKLLWSVSLDSHDENFHDTFRGLKGAHRKVSENIKILRKHGHIVKVSMSVTDDNFDHIKQTMDYVHDELGASHFGFAEVLPIGRGAQIEKKDAVTKETLQERIDKIEEIRVYSDSKYPEFMAWLSKEEMEIMRKTLKNCGAGWKTITIGPDGNIRPCVMMEDGIMCQGNINKQSIEEIMKENQKEKLYDLNMPNENECESSCFNIPFCKYCFYRGLLTNVERVKQGLEVCEWAKRYGLEKFIVNFSGVNLCSSRKCDF